MSAPFPHHYEVDLTWHEDRSGLLRGGPRPVLVGGPPPQFDGSAKWWSPEELLLSAVNLCMMTTFLAVAAKNHLGVLAYKSKAEGALDKGPTGIGFTSMMLTIELRVAQPDVERAEKLVNEAKKYCIISNSLKHQPELKVTVHE